MANSFPHTNDMLEALDLAAPHDFFPFDLDMITLVLSSEAYFGIKTLALESAIHIGRSHASDSLVAHGTGDIEVCWG